MATFAPHQDRYSHTAVWPDNVDFPVEIKDGEAHFEFDTIGPWQTVRHLSGVAIEHTENGIIIHGKRSLSHPREDGYCVRGTVSVNGKNRRAFTSSQLFLVKGKLVSVGVLYVTKK